MKLLVTGGAGYIGSHTTQALLQAGHEVVVLDNLSTGFPESLPDVKLIIADVRDKVRVTSLLRDQKIEGVVHFAAKLIVPESVEKPLEYYDNNVYGTLCLLQACAEARVQRFVFSSTASIYGENPGRPLLETDPTDPINTYAATKRASENMLRDYAIANPDFRYVALRYFNVAGASMLGNNGQRSRRATHLIKVACEVALGKRQQMEIFGQDYSTPDGTCLRDYIHIDDLAQAHVDAVQAIHAGHPGGIFNCGYGHGISVKQVIAMVEKVAGKKINARPATRRSGDPTVLVANSNKLQNELHWTPRLNSLETICRTALEWERRL